MAPSQALGGFSRHAGPRVAPGRQQHSGGYRPAWGTVVARPTDVLLSTVGARVVAAAVVGGGRLGRSIRRGHGRRRGFGRYPNREAKLHFDRTWREGRVRLQHDSSRKVLHHVEGVCEIARAVVDEGLGEISRHLPEVSLVTLSPCVANACPAHDRCVVASGDPHDAHRRGSDGVREDVAGPGLDHLVVIGLHWEKDTRPSPRRRGGSHLTWDRAQEVAGSNGSSKPLDFAVWATYSGTYASSPEGEVGLRVMGQSAHGPSTPLASHWRCLARISAKASHRRSSGNGTLRCLADWELSWRH